MGLQSIRDRAVEGDDSFAGHRRAKRWNWLVETFPHLEEMEVLDLGGYPSTWTRGTVHPKHVHVVNIEDLSGDVPDWISVEQGDACALPAQVAARRYDLAYSNSVIEHVGGHERRLRFAESILNAAPAHWVQTPYRYFPVEPHWIAPGMQFLPSRLRASVAQWWPLAHVKSTDLRDGLTGVLWTELIDKTQMRYYFPDSALKSERLLGFTKSIIAVKTA